MEKTELKDLLDARSLFCPEVFYEGEWILNFTNIFPMTKYSTLYLNSKSKRGHNFYEEFIDKIFYKPIRTMLNCSNEAEKHFTPVILSTVDNKTNKRSLKFSIYHFIKEHENNFIGFECIDEMFDLWEEDDSVEEIIEKFRNVVRKERNNVFDVAKNGKNSLYYKQVYRNYEQFKDDNNSNMSFDKFLLALKYSFSNLLMAMRNYANFLSKEINYQELLNCFDYDKFCLAVSYNVMEQCKETEKESNTINNAINFVIVYLGAIKVLRQNNPKYNINIRIPTNKLGVTKNYTLDELIIEYEELLNRHPEFKIFDPIANKEKFRFLLKRHGLSEEEIANFDLSNKENIDLITKLLQDFDKEQEIFTQFEIFPKGKSEEKNSKRPHIINESIDYSELQRRKQISEEFLEASPFLYEIYGKDRFVGFKGRVYPNKTIIFEFQDPLERKPKNVATYAMDIYNFMELSKLSKKEIMELLKKDPTLNVERIFHYADMNRWMNRITSIINGDDYTEEIVDYINELIKTNALTRNRD